MGKFHFPILILSFVIALPLCAQDQTIPSDEFASGGPLQDEEEEQ